MTKEIGGLLIKDFELLIVRGKNGIFHIPSSKPDFPENYEETLQRIFIKQLSGTRVNVISYYGFFSDNLPKYREGLELNVYFCKLNSNLGKASDEVVDSFFVDSSDINNYKFSEVTRKVLNRLKKDKLIR